MRPRGVEGGRPAGWGAARMSNSEPIQTSIQIRTNTQIQTFKRAPSGDNVVAEPDLERAVHNADVIIFCAPHQVTETPTLLAGV